MRKAPWRSPAGEPISCEEKIKVLDDNLAEIAGLYRDALEDAVLMGCDVEHVRQVFKAMIDTTDVTFAPSKKVT